MREIDGIPVYNITLENEYSDGEDLGIDMIAFTNMPAIKTKGLAFKQLEPKKQFFADDTKMRIAAPAMIPMDIYRADEDGEYYVNFSAEVIEQIYSKFMKNLTNKDVFNLEHEADKKVPAYLLESFIVDSDAKIKMVKDEYNVDVPKGSIFVVSQITDRSYYNELVTNEQIGYSIEGFLGLKLNNHNKMDKQQFELDGKFYEVVEGKLVPVAMEEVEVETEETPVAEVAEVPEIALEDEVKEEEVEAMEDGEEKEEEVEMEVNPEVDAEAVMAIVAPALDALRNELLEAIADKKNEDEEEEVEVEMEEVKMSGLQKLSAFMRVTNK